MRNRPSILALLVLVLLTANAKARDDQFTPLVCSTPVANARPFQGTDGRLHIVYELVLTNTNPTPATLKTVEVLDSSKPSNVLASFADRELLARLRTTGGSAVDNPTIEFNGTRLFLIDLSLDPAITPPDRLLHNVEVLAAPSPARKPRFSLAIRLHLWRSFRSCPGSVLLLRARAG